LRLPQVVPTTGNTDPTLALHAAVPSDEETSPAAGPKLLADQITELATKAVTDDRIGCVAEAETGSLEPPEELGLVIALQRVCLVEPA
jgi:hypothetical protein